MAAEPLEARIARAKAYPFPRHDHCFLFQDGAAIPLPQDVACDTAGRVPVLGFVNDHFAGHAPETARQLREALRRWGIVFPERR